MKKPEISIIIPTKNEEEGIAKVICSIPPEIAKKSEVLVVDSSTDLTPVIAKKLGARVLRVRGGKGKAMREGAKRAKGKILVFLDGDAADPPSFIPKLLEKLEKCDVVLGARNPRKRCKNVDMATEMLFKVYKPSITMFFKILGFKIKGDPLAGFRAMRKETWKALELKSNDFLIETEMNLKILEKGLKVGEVPIPVLRRTGGLLKSKLVTNPSQCVKIFNYGIRYAKEKKLKARLEKLKKKFLKLKEILVS